MSTFYDFLALDPEKPGDDSQQEKWFAGTEIFDDKEFCSKYMGKSPVNLSHLNPYPEVIF